jgi:hypothetical protein
VLKKFSQDPEGIEAKKAIPKSLYSYYIQYLYMHIHICTFTYKVWKVKENNGTQRLGK